MSGPHEEKDLNESDLKRVKLTKQAFGKRSIYIERKAEVDVPELNALMGLEDGQTAYMIIRQLDLSAFVKGQEEEGNYINNLVQGILSAAVEAGKVKEEVQNAMKKPSPESKYTIHILKEGIIEPELNESDVVFIAKSFPMVALRLREKILKLTTQGADIKKNS